MAFPAAAAVAALGFAEALRLALLDAPWPQVGGQANEAGSY